jgi:hypothetical protein
MSEDASEPKAGSPGGSAGGGRAARSADAPLKGEEPRWHAGIAVLVALVLYVTLPTRILIGPAWVLPVILLLILLPLMILSPHRHQEAPWQRWASIAQVAILNAFNVASVVQLLFWQFSVQHHRQIPGEQLFVGAVQIWLTNIIVYALWFWEIDGRGPDVRYHTAFYQEPRRADFLFPQMMLQDEIRNRIRWKPMFLDYVFLSFTNATAFSPTDTFPLTRFAKVLMMAEALISLVTIAVIASRAINILGT